MQATGQRIGTVFQAIGTFGFALVLSLIYEWRVGLVALAFVPLMAAILYKEGRMVSAESFGTAKTMEASSKVKLQTSHQICLYTSTLKYILKYTDSSRSGVECTHSGITWQGRDIPQGLRYATLTSPQLGQAVRSLARHRLWPLTRTL